MYGRAMDNNEQDYRSILAALGAEFRGVQPGPRETLILFADPRSGSTLAVAESEFTPCRTVWKSAGGRLIWNCWCKSRFVKRHGRCARRGLQMGDHRPTAERTDFVHRKPPHFGQVRTKRDSFLRGPTLRPSRLSVDPSTLRVNRSEGKKKSARSVRNDGWVLASASCRDMLRTSLRSVGAVRTFFLRWADN
jgi:hypothetical protein